MKNRINYIVLRSILAFCIVIVIVIMIKLRTDAKIIYRIHQSKIEQAVEEILNTGKVDGIKIPGVDRIDYWEGELIEFTTSSFGIVTACTYQGFYYSVDGCPVAFQNSNETLKNHGEFWEWKSRAGYNGVTQKLEGNYFLFKANF